MYTFPELFRVVFQDCNLIVTQCNNRRGKLLLLLIQNPLKCLKASAYPLSTPLSTPEYPCLFTTYFINTQV